MSSLPGGVFTGTAFTGSFYFENTFMQIPIGVGVDGCSSKGFHPVGNAGVVVCALEESFAVLL